MTRTLGSTLLAAIPLLLTALLVLTDARPAHAMPCFTNLANCYTRAALIDGFWYRWAAGLDCELDFVSCLREDLSGW